MKPVGTHASMLSNTNEIEEEEKKKRKKVSLQDEEHLIHSAIGSDGLPFNPLVSLKQWLPANQIHSSVKGVLKW